MGASPSLRSLDPELGMEGHSTGKVDCGLRCAKLAMYLPAC